MTETEWTEYLRQVLKDLQEAHEQPGRYEQLIMILEEELAAFGVTWNPQTGLKKVEEKP